MVTMQEPSEMAESTPKKGRKSKYFGLPRWIEIPIISVIVLVGLLIIAMFAFPIFAIGFFMVTSWFEDDDPFDNAVESVSKPISCDKSDWYKDTLAAINKLSASAMATETSTRHRECYKDGGGFYTFRFKTELSKTDAQAALKEGFKKQGWGEVLDVNCSSKPVSGVATFVTHPEYRDGNIVSFVVSSDSDECWFDDEQVDDYDDSSTM